MNKYLLRACITVAVELVQVALIVGALYLAHEASDNGADLAAWLVYVLSGVALIAAMVVWVLRAARLELLTDVFLEQNRDA